MTLIGLTGGIASGKSTVARRLAEHGAIIIDADQLARDVVAPGTPGLAAVAEAFGQGILQADGSLDRAALGQLVFQHPAERERLEAIMHPAIHELFARRLEAAGPNAIVVYDVPLLVETDNQYPFDLVVVVHAGAEKQLERLMNERGLDLETARARIAAQASDEQRLARADVVIDSSGSLAHTVAQADALWADKPWLDPLTKLR